MRPGAGRKHGQPPPQEQPQQQPHGTGPSRNARLLYRTCAACQAKNVTKTTDYAFSDNAVQCRYVLAIFPVGALNTRGHLQGAATDGHREAQRSSAGLTCRWPEASAGACWSVEKP